MTYRQIKKRLWQGAHERIFSRFAEEAARGRREIIRKRLVANRGWHVQGGPFQGLLIPADISQGDGDIVPKLLGCYEAELHEVLREIAATSYSTVVNVGCAEGYYATGFAKLLPEVGIVAFDSDSEARRICQTAAKSNGVSDRIEIRGLCSTGDLRGCLTQSAPTLLFMDCEGAELDLLSFETIPALRSCDVLVECHDFVNPAISATLRRRFASSHHIEEIREGARDPNVSPDLRRLGDLDRWLAVCEFRPERMTWLWCKTVVSR